MDLDKIFNFVTKYVSDYVSVFFATLLNPRSTASIIRQEYFDHRKIVSPLAGVPAIEIKGKHRIPPKLFGFVTISIAIGFVFQKLIPDPGKNH